MFPNPAALPPNTGPLSVSRTASAPAMALSPETIEEYHGDTGDANRWPASSAMLSRAAQALKEAADADFQRYAKDCSGSVMKTLSAAVEHRRPVNGEGRLSTECYWRRRRTDEDACSNYRGGLDVEPSYAQ